MTLASHINHSCMMKNDFTHSNATEQHPALSSSQWSVGGPDFTPKLLYFVHGFKKFKFSAGLETCLLMLALISLSKGRCVQKVSGTTSATCLYQRIFRRILLSFINIFTKFASYFQKFWFCTWLLRTGAFGAFSYISLKYAWLLAY